MVEGNIPYATFFLDKKSSAKKSRLRDGFAHAACETFPGW
jgi:hypothetical protein